MFRSKFSIGRVLIGLSVPIMIYTYLYFLIFPNVFSIITANKNFTVKRERNGSSDAGCHLPVLDPFDPEITTRELFSTQEECSGIPSIVYVDVDNVLRVNTSSLTFFNLTHPSDVKCTAESITLEKDEILRFSNPVKLSLPDLLKSDFNRVKCTSGQGKPLFNNIVAGIRKAIEGRRQGPIEEKAADRLSVFVFVIDSVSRSSAIRSLPKTLAYLDALQSYEFRGYMTIGLNTFPNMFGLLTGQDSTAKTTKTRMKMKDMRFDDFPFLWNNFSEKGYVTMFSEDGSIFSSHRGKGFLKQPTDHYMWPFWLFLKTNEHRGQNISKLCNQNTMKYMETINYSKHFMLQYKNKRKFGISYVSRLAHSVINYLKNADEDIRQFFQWMHLSGVLEKTVVLFLSDHGPRLSKARPSITGRLESRLPMLHIMLPNHIKEKYSNIDANLKQNSDRLVSQFDIRQTLIDVININYKNPTVQFVNGKPRGVSLFREISKSRTCTDADIPVEFCVCQQRESNVNVKNTSLIQSVAKQLVAHINQLVSVNPECQKLTLNRTLHMKFAYRLRKLDSGKHANHSGRNEYRMFYVLTIQTVPGFAAFEAFCETDISMEKFTFIIIKRVNRYKGQDICEMRTVLKKFCYCKNAKIANSFDI